MELRKSRINCWWDELKFEIILSTDVKHSYDNPSINHHQNNHKAMPYTCLDTRLKFRITRSNISDVVVFVRAERPRGNQRLHLNATGRMSQYPRWSFPRCILTISDCRYSVEYIQLPPSRHLKPMKSKFGTSRICFVSFPSAFQIVDYMIVPLKFDVGLEFWPVISRLVSYVCGVITCRWFPRSAASPDWAVSGGQRTLAKPRAKHDGLPWNYRQCSPLGKGTDPELVPRSPAQLADVTKILLAYTVQLVPR